MITLESIPRAFAGRASVVRRHLRRARQIGAAIALVLLAGYLGTALLVATVMATAEAAPFSVITALLAALPGWLAVHQVPLLIMDGPLSVFPLVPTGLVMLLVATASSQVARRGRLRRPDQARWIVLPMGLAHGVVGAAVALIMGGTVEVDPVSAFLHCALLALIASTAGLANRCGLTYLVWEHVRSELWSGIRVSLSALAATVAVGAFLVLAGLLLSLPEFVAMLGATGSPGDAFGLTLLSLLYLPNAVLAGWAFVVGGGFSIGAVEVSPLNMTSGAVPEVPLLTLLPASGPAWWWVIFFVLPLLWGGWIGRSCLRVGMGAKSAFWILATVALLVSTAMGLATGLAGGQLGGAAFGPITLHPGLVALTTLGWIAIPAAIVVWFGRPDADFEDADFEDADFEDADFEDDAVEDAESGSADPDGADPEAAEPHEAVEAVEAELHGDSPDLDGLEDLDSDLEDVDPDHEDASRPGVQLADPGPDEYLEADPWSVVEPGGDASSSTGSPVPSDDAVHHVEVDSTGNDSGGPSSESPAGAGDDAQSPDELAGGGERGGSAT